MVELAPEAKVVVVFNALNPISLNAVVCFVPSLKDKLVVVALVVKRLVEEVTPVAVMFVKLGVEVTATLAPVKTILEPAEIVACAPRLESAVEEVIAPVPPFTTGTGF